MLHILCIIFKERCARTCEGKNNIARNSAPAQYLFALAAEAHGRRLLIKTQESNGRIITQSVVMSADRRSSIFLTSSLVAAAPA